MPNKPKPHAAADELLLCQDANGFCLSPASHLKEHCLTNVPVPQVSSASASLVTSASSHSFLRTNKSFPSNVSLPTSKSCTSKLNSDDLNNQNIKRWQKCDNFNPAIHAYKYSYVPVVKSSRTATAAPLHKLTDVLKFNSLKSISMYLSFLCYSVIYFC